LVGLEPTHARISSLPASSATVGFSQSTPFANPSAFPFNHFEKLSSSFSIGSVCSASATLIATSSPNSSSTFPSAPAPHRSTTYSTTIDDS
jgi:hypothetical protein